MTYIPSYPIEGVQHCRCLLAVTITKTMLDLFKPGPSCSAKIKQQIDKVNRWLDECSYALQGRRLSQGAKRDLDRTFSVLSDYLEMKGLEQNALMERWAAMMYASWTFVLDVLATCPEYRSPAWGYLAQTLETLNKYFAPYAPMAEEEGTAIYMEAI